MSNIFFCSDHHFNHRRSIDFDNRPYNNIQEMDEDLIKKHNSIVNKDDTVYFLGDISFNQSYNTYKEIFSKLNGNKYFIVGNHDNRQNLIRCQKDGLLLDVKESKILNIGKDTIHLTHYPLLEFYNFYKGGYHLFGHTHLSSCPELNKSANVCICCWEWQPVEWSEVKKYIDSNCKENKHIYY